MNDQVKLLSSEEWRTNKDKQQTWNIGERSSEIILKNFVSVTEDKIQWFMVLLAIVLLQILFDRWCFADKQPWCAA